MNAIAYYKCLLDFLKGDIGLVEAERLCQKNRFGHPDPLSRSGLENLRRTSVKHIESEGGHDESRSATEAFLLVAFVDLTPSKNPRAMQIFSSLDELHNGKKTDKASEVIVWRKKALKRSDGSGVMTLHVSDLQAFEVFLSEHDGIGSFMDSSGKMLYL